MSGRPLILLPFAMTAGCDGGDAVVDDDTPTRDTTASPTTSATTGTTGTTGDTAGTTVPSYPDDCIPTVAVPGDPKGVPDPHAATFGAEPVPYDVHLTWPGTDPSVSAAFLWRTDTDTLASQVELTPQGGATQVMDGVSFTYGTSGTLTDVYRIHEVRLCQQLAPGTVYQYRVGGAGNWSPEGTFQTPGAPASFDTFRIAVAGDSRDDALQWGMIVQAMASYDPDFYLFTGDAVGSGSNQAQWDNWFRATLGAFAERAIVPVHGNHEALAANWFAQFALPGNELWYRVRFGSLDLVVLNDSSVTPDERATQADWVATTLGGSDAAWKIAVHHQSPYATCARHGSNLDLRAEWVPVYEAAGVDLVINGHNHIYERSLPILGDAESDLAAGITYVVTGGGGAPLYLGVEPDWFSSVANPIEHFLILDFSPTGLHGVARDLSGNVIDDFTIPVDGS